MTPDYTIRTLKQNARIVSTTCLLAIQALVVLFAVTCQDGAKQIIVDNDPSKLYHLSGLVLDYQTEQPVADVTVKVYADSTYRTTTDTTGAYLLTLGIEPGVYYVKFEGRGLGYANMLGKISLPEIDPASNGHGKPALSPNQISVTNDVRLYPLSKQVTGTVLGSYTWDYPDVDDDSICILPLPYCAPVYISYQGVGPVERADMTLGCNLYTVCTDNDGDYSFQNIPHTDSAFIGIVPFHERGSFYYGSQTAISLDNSEPIEIQLEAAPLFDVMYAYRAFDTLQRESVIGWLGMNDPDSTGQFTGGWSIRKDHCQQWATDMGPHEGNGLLTGRIDDGKVTIELNPDMADNNVTLVADTSSTDLQGTWHYSNFTGEVNRGPFTTHRLTTEP